MFEYGTVYEENTTIRLVRYVYLELVYIYIELIYIYIHTYMCVCIYICVCMYVYIHYTTIQVYPYLNPIFHAG